jgi:hypothetical protein
VKAALTVFEAPPLGNAFSPVKLSFREQQAGYRNGDNYQEGIEDICIHWYFVCFVLSGIRCPVCQRGLFTEQPMTANQLRHPLPKRRN